MTLTHIKYVEEFRQREKRIAKRQKERMLEKEKEEKDQTIKTTSEDGHDPDLNTSDMTKDDETTPNDENGDNTEVDSTLNVKKERSEAVKDIEVGQISGDVTGVQIVSTKEVLILLL